MTSSLGRMSENSRSKIQLATGMAMTVRTIMILLYGAGGVPGRGESPMNTMKHIVTQAFPARQVCRKRLQETAGRIRPKKADRVEK